MAMFFYSFSFTLASLRSNKPSKVELLGQSPNFFFIFDRFVKMSFCVFRLPLLFLTPLLTLPSQVCPARRCGSPAEPVSPGAPVGCPGNSDRHLQPGEAAE